MSLTPPIRAVGRHARRAAMLCALAALAHPAVAHAQTNLFAIGPTSGNQSFVGLLGYDLLTRDKPIEITRIGAFDDDQDGFNRTITVRMWNQQNGQEIGGVYTFSGVVGSLVGGYRFIDLATPLRIEAYTSFGIYSSGYGIGEDNYNTGLPPGGAMTFDGGGLVDYRTSWYQSEGAPFATQSGGVLFGAPNIAFRDATLPQSTVPEPGTVALLGGGLLAMAGVARRRRAR